MRKIVIAILSAGALIAPGFAFAQSPSVTVYTNCDFTGKSATFGSGNYRITDMHKKGLLNDVISSIKVGRNSSVAIFKHDKFSGNTRTYTKDVRCLKGTGLNDDISSFRVTRPESRPRPNNDGTTGNTGRVIKHEDGRFERTGSKIWTEFDRNGRTIGSYEQLSRRNQRLFLYDARREELIEIDRREGTVRSGPFGQTNPVRNRLQHQGSQAIDDSNLSDFGVTAENALLIKFRDSSSNKEGQFRRQGRLGGNWDYEDNSGKLLDRCEELSAKSSRIELECEKIKGVIVLDIFWDTVTLEHNGSSERVAKILKSYRAK